MLGFTSDLGQSYSLLHSLKMHGNKWKMALNSNMLCPKEYNIKVI